MSKECLALTTALTLGTAITLYVLGSLIDSDDYLYDDLEGLPEACRNGNLETARFLIEHGTDINKANTNGYTPLHIACYYGHLEIAQLLTQHGAKTNARTSQGTTPRGIAWQNSKTIIINYLNQLAVSEQNFDNYYTQVTPELLQRFIACKIHDNYVLKHFSAQNKEVQKELMFHALLHNTRILIKMAYYSYANHNELLLKPQTLADNTCLQQKYVDYRKQLPPQKNANGWKKESPLSQFADITVTFSK